MIAITLLSDLKITEKSFFIEECHGLASKAFYKSMRIIPASRPESKLVNIFSVRYESEVSAESFL